MLYEKELPHHSRDTTRWGLVLEEKGGSFRSKPSIALNDIAKLQVFIHVNLFANCKT